MKKYLFLGIFSLFSTINLMADDIDYVDIDTSQSIDGIQKQIREQTHKNHEVKLALNFFKFNNELLKGSDALSGFEYTYHNPGGYKLEISSTANQATKYTTNYRFNFTNKYHIPYGENTEIFPIISISSSCQSCYLDQQDLDRGLQKTQFSFGFGFIQHLSNYFSYSPEITFYHDISRLRVCRKSNAPIHWWASNLEKLNGFRVSLGLKTIIGEYGAIEFSPFWERSINKEDDVRGSKITFAFLF